MIYVGIDDTDTLDSPGTNQLAKVLAQDVAADFRCQYILRHQLLFDPRVHYTSKNGSASIWFIPTQVGSVNIESLVQRLRRRMLDWYVPGSDPGLCVCSTISTPVPDEIIEWGRRCKRDLVNQQLARNLAAKHHIFLEGLGGTEGGIIGALAAVGLAATNNDGRVVRHADWPDDLTGCIPVTTVLDRGIIVRCSLSNRTVIEGTVEVGKHLRPNFREGQVVLFVRPGNSTDEMNGAERTADWISEKLT